MLAICAAGLSGVMDCINPVNGVAMQMTVNRTVPNTLNIRWMMVVRLALRLVPMEAKTAVIQVPMFCPKMNVYRAVQADYPTEGQRLQDTHRGGGGLETAVKRHRPGFPTED